jgi:hypothetical protein
MTQQDIGARAYELWEKEGRPDGRDLAHWLEAERFLQQQTPAPAAAPRRDARQKVSRQR